MKKFVNISFFYLILGLIAGVFFREFTKMNNFTGVTTLSVVHTHTLVLGFLFFLIVLILEKLFNISSAKQFNIWLILYNVSLIYVIGAFVFRGILQVLGNDFNGLNHIAGLGHFMLGASLIWFALIVKRSVARAEA